LGKFQELLSSKLEANFILTYNKIKTFNDYRVSLYVLVYITNSTIIPFNYPTFIIL